jgi:hypothetical protein
VTQPKPAGTVVDGVNIDAVHTAVSNCPGVAAVGSGTLAALTTYLPGRRIPGIRINPDSVELEIVADWDATAAHIASEIRVAVAGLADGRRIDITIADIVLPGEQPSQDGKGPPPPLAAARETPAIPPAPTHPPVIAPER